MFYYVYKEACAWKYSKKNILIEGVLQILFHLKKIMRFSKGVIGFEYLPVSIFNFLFYKNKWYVKRNKLLDENGKLRTYLKLKCNFGFENYLHILSDFIQRKSFTKFRISNHKLKIETGRYSKPIN
jgi:hypothetical protein